MKWPVEMVPFELALDDETPGQTKVQRSDYLADGAVPVIDQGQKAVAGYTNDPGLAYEGPLPVILFGDHTLLFKHVDFPFALGADGVRALTAKPPFLSKFLFYYLTSVRIASRGYSRHFKFLREVRFPHIAEKEQRRIVELLEQADGLRRKRAEADTLADRIMPALFHKMFGDPATNPKGWPRVRLETVIADTRNGLYKHADFYGRGTQILKMFNILSGRLNLERVDRVELDADELAAYRLEVGDILVNRVNTPELVGKCAVIPTELGEAVFESKNIRLRLKADVAEPNYVAHFLNTGFGHATLCQGVKHAIGMATINNSDVRNCRLPVPPIAKQQEWATHVAAIRKLAAQADAARANLERLFQFLLHRAFTGELTAEWREAHLKELLAEMEQQARLLNVKQEA